MSRKLLFVSHANPEDNEFTLWLCSRLTSLGYLVWSDLTKLFGAEIFWDDIEDAIRNHSAKVIVVLSRAAQQKNGVLDEIQLAVSVERSQKIDRFVVPSRIDSIPHTDVKPNLARKNIIDFNGKWPEGFGNLLKVLERDNVPKGQTLSAREIGAWVKNIVDNSQRIVQEPQPLLSNWFPINSLPETLYFYRASKGNIQGFGYPWVSYQDMVASFASLDDLKEFLPSWHVPMLAHKIPLSAVLNKEPHGLPQLELPEVLNFLSYLIRTSWDASMYNKGLLPYEMSNGRKAWYPAKDGRYDGWMKFQDMGGVEKRKRLVGWSEKRKVFWHFAVEALPSIAPKPKLVLKPHVVFTRDGCAQVSKNDEMHRLRRGFCRSWWNSRWRDLMLAYMAMIVDQNDYITLPMGSGQQLLVEPRPLFFETPVSISTLEPPQIVEDESDNDLDKISDDQEWEDVDELEEENYQDISTDTEAKNHDN